MPASIVTTEDLYDFKLELLQEIKLIIGKLHYDKTKTWLKSTEVMEILKISPGTLQGLRLSGVLPYSKIGGSIFYDSKELNRVLEDNLSNKEV